MKMSKELRAKLLAALKEHRILTKRTDPKGAANAISEILSENGLKPKSNSRAFVLSQILQHAHMESEKHEGQFLGGLLDGIWNWVTGDTPGDSNPPPNEGDCAALDDMLRIANARLAEAMTSFGQCIAAGGSGLNLQFETTDAPVPSGPELAPGSCSSWIDIAVRQSENIDILLRGKAAAGCP